MDQSLAAEYDKTRLLILLPGQQFETRAFDSPWVDRVWTLTLTSTDNHCA